MRRRTVIKVLAILTAFFGTAYIVAGIERLVGNLCGISICGPDELPFVSGLIVSAVVAMLCID